MSRRTIQLIDQAGLVVGVAQVSDEGECLTGTIDTQSMSADLKSLFEEWEQAVNDQVFESLDDLQDRISACHIRALFDDGRAARVADLQVYPRPGTVSFRLAETPAGLMKSA